MTEIKGYKDSKLLDQSLHSVGAQTAVAITLMRIPGSFQEHLIIPKPIRPTQKPAIFSLRIGLDIRSSLAF